MRQYFSLFRAVPKEEERNDRLEQPPSAPTSSALGPCPTISEINRKPRHRKFTQHNRTTRHPHTVRNLTPDGNAIKKIFKSGIDRENIGSFVRFGCLVVSGLTAL